MKKVLLTLALVATFGIASAQFEQGSYLVGATSNLSFTSEDDGVSDDNFNTFNLGVRGGYFLMDNLAAGLNIGFTSFSQGDFSSSTFGVGPFARYYVNGMFYAGAGLDFESESPDEGDSVSGTQLKFEAGYPIFIGGETVAIEPSLNYWIGGGDLNEDETTFAVNVGFFLYF